MRIDKAGLPFIAGALAPALGFALARRPRLALPMMALAGFMAYFFRDPERHPPAGDRLALAPADGRVLVAGSPEPGVAPPGAWQQISIFLSPLDVHVNRVPVSGTVRRLGSTPGRFLPAYRPMSAQENERTELWIDTGSETVVVRQVVGVLARRIVCRVAEGAVVRAGDRIGLMKFGSRMDVFVPPTARLLGGVGARVRAAESILAHLADPAPAG